MDLKTHVFNKFSGKAATAVTSFLLDFLTDKVGNSDVLWINENKDMEVLVHYMCYNIL